MHLQQKFYFLNVHVNKMSESTDDKMEVTVFDTMNSDIMESGRTVLLENHINAHDSEIRFVQLK